MKKPDEEDQRILIGKLTFSEKNDLVEEMVKPMEERGCRWWVVTETETEMRVKGWRENPNPRRENR